MKAKDLKPGQRVIIGFNHAVTVNATEHIGEHVRVEWEEPYEDYYYELEDELREAD